MDFFFHFYRQKVKYGNTWNITRPDYITICVGLNLVTIQPIVTQVVWLQYGDVDTVKKMPSNNMHQCLKGWATRFSRAQHTSLFGLVCINFIQLKQYNYGYVILSREIFFLCQCDTKGDNDCCLNILYLLRLTSLS